jgi:MioC protein
MTYSATFCGGGHRFDTLLSELGARRIGTVLEHDASSKIYPEDAARTWLETWIPLLEESNLVAS